jgi:hypothetical protein
LFRTCGAYLRGVEGVDKWDLKRFGKGKAEADDDLLDLDDSRNWDLDYGICY